MTEAAAARKGTDMYNGTDPTRYNRNLKNVPVIISFSADGKMLPLYFRYNGVSYHIDRLVSADTDCPPFYKYECEITRGDTVHKVGLEYNLNSTSWMLDLGRCI